MGPNQNNLQLSVTSVQSSVLRQARLILTGGRAARPHDSTEQAISLRIVEIIPELYTWRRGHMERCSLWRGADIVLLQKGHPHRDLNVLSALGRRPIIFNFSRS
jgi:hypothetical protein